MSAFITPEVNIINGDISGLFVVSYRGFKHEAISLVRIHFGLLPEPRVTKVARDGGYLCLCAINVVLYCRINTNNLIYGLLCRGAGWCKGVCVTVRRYYVCILL